MCTFEYYIFLCFAVIKIIDFIKEKISCSLLPVMENGKIPVGCLALFP